MIDDCTLVFRLLKSLRLHVFSSNYILCMYIHCSIHMCYITLCIGCTSVYVGM